MKRLSAIFMSLSIAAFVAGCGGGDSEFPTTDGTGKNIPIPEQGSNRDRGSLFGGGFKLFGGGDKETVSAGIGVNSYLWRASLDTLSFMPMQSADPFGGVIITDWYEDPAAAGERFKVTVYILDQRLRADGLKVAVFRQKSSGRGWTDSPVNPSTAVDIENAILTKARQLRIDSIEN